MKAIINEGVPKYFPNHLLGIKFDSVEDFKKHSKQLYDLKIDLNYTKVPSLSKLYLEDRIANYFLSNVKVVDKKQTGDYRLVNKELLEILIRVPQKKTF